MNNQKKKKGDEVFFKSHVLLLETALEAFGIPIRVVEVETKDGNVVFFCEVALGSEIKRILRLKRDIALAVASPSGKVTITAPVPGTSLISIEFPYPALQTRNKEKYKILRVQDKLLGTPPKKTVKDVIADGFDILGTQTFRFSKWLRAS